MFRLLLLVLAFTGFAPLAAAATGQIVRLTNGEWAPWLGEHLPHFGPASQAVSEAFALEGWRVEYGFYPWSRAFELAKQGDYDGSIGWSYAPSREAYFLFSEPFFWDYDVLFYRRDFAFDWQGQVQELTGYTLGRTLSYSYGQMFDRFAHPPTMQVDMAPSDLINLTKLIHGRIQLFPLSWRVGVALLAEAIPAAQAAQLICHPVPLRVAEYRVLLAKKSPRGAAAQDALNRGLAKLAASGRLQQIFASSDPLPLAEGGLPCRPQPQNSKERVK